MASSEHAHGHGHDDEQEIAHITPLKIYFAVFGALIFLTVVTVALDIEPQHTYQWIDAASPTHPSLIDTTHITGDLFGFVNIPMAVWIDEDGNIVRPAEGASVERSPLRDMEIPEGLPPRIDQMFREVKKIPDDAEGYRAAIVDWVVKRSTAK